MKKSIIKAYLIVFSLYFFLTPPGNVLAQSDVDYSQMHSDLRIMESVITTILSGSEVRDFYRSRILRSSYLEGYGAVFQLTYSPVRFRSSRLTNARNQFNDIRERLTGVYADYAGALKLVRPDESVTILVYPKSASSIRQVGSVSRGSSNSNATFEPQPYSLSARMSDIINLDRNNAAQLSRVVRYTPYVNADELFGSADMKEDIAILQSILERSLEDHLKTGFSSNFAQGCYLPGYGILLNLSVSQSIFVSGTRISLVSAGSLILDSLITGSRRIVISIDNPDRFIDRNIALLARQERTKSAGERKSDFIDRLAEILGTYGGTLKELDRGDTITVFMTSQGSSWNLPVDLNLVFSVKQRDLLDYGNGRISLSELKNRSKIVEF